MILFKKFRIQSLQTFQKIKAVSEKISKNMNQFKRIPSIKHTYMCFMLIKIKRIHMHFMDIRHKTHKFMFCMHYFSFKLAFCSFSENLFKYSDFFFLIQNQPWQKIFEIVCQNEHFKGIFGRDSRGKNNMRHLVVLFWAIWLVKGI